MDLKQKRIFEAVAARVPHLIVEQQIAAPDLPGVRGNFLYGTLMFADISGFTDMSEKLSEQGKEGAEELTGILNNCFTRMLNIAFSYGGCHLKFGGDAMLLFFLGHRHAALAVRCALKMQQAMKYFHHVTTSQGPFKLAMSIGVNTGEFFEASVGSPEERLFCLLTGKETNRTAEIEAVARAGEIFVSPGTLHELRGRIETGDEREGYHELKSLAARVRSITPDRPYPEEKDLKKVTGVLASYLPKQIAKRIKANPERADMDGEHRRVTMMFVNFFGASELIEECGGEAKAETAEILNEYFLKLHETVNKYEGVILGCDLSTRGDKIIIIFGAPVAHEDDEERAVRCAMEMKQMLAGSGLPFQQRIGINTGHVYSGEVGSTSRKEYTVIGDQVNLAARLMAAAQEGQIIIGSSTCSKIKGKFLFKEHDPVTVKGKIQPVPAYQVESIGDERVVYRQRITGDLVGREKEVEEIKGTIERVFAGQGKTMGITGVAGIGKSRLVQELANLWTRRGGSVYIGNCRSYGNRIPYLPWIDVLNSFFKFQTVDSDTLRIQKIETVISELCPDLRDWAALLGNLLGVPVPESELLKSLDPRLRHQRLMDIILELLQVQANKNQLLLIFEDLHWADAASADLLKYIADNIEEHPLLLCLAYRPREKPGFGLKLPGNFREVVLSELSQESSLELARSIMNLPELPQELSKLMIDKSRGNPLFVKELISSLIDTGHLELNADTGEYRISGELRMVKMPDSIQMLIVSHMDQLQKETANVLRIASVIGEVFQYDVLKDIYPRPITDRELKRRLVDLVNSGLARLHTDKPVLEYYFNHALTHDVAYETLLFAHRRGLHHKVGDYLEKRHSDQIDSYYELLAYHYSRAMDKEKTLEYSVRAGNKVQEIFANKEAINYYQKALELAVELPERSTGALISKIHEALGDIYELTGQYDQALQSYLYCRQWSENFKARRRRRPKKEILVESLFPGSPSPKFGSKYLPIIHCKIGQVYRRKGQYETALESLDEGMKMLGEVGVEKARLFIARAGVLYRQGKYNLALEWCRRGLDIAQEVDTVEDQAHAYYLTGNIYSEMGYIEQGIEYSLHSLRLYQQCSDLPGQANAHNNLAIDYYYQGDWEKAREHYHKSVEIKERTGDISGFATTVNNLGELLSDQGHLDKAIESFRQCLTTFKKMGYSMLEAIAYSNLGRAYVRQGDCRQGLVLLQQGVDIFEKIQSGFLAETYLRLAEAYLGLGQPETALEHCTRSLIMAQEQKMTVVEGMAQRLMGQAYRLLEEWNRAEELLVQSEKMLRGLGVPFELSQTWWQLGLLYHHMARAGYQPDREGRARQLLAEAKETFDKLGVKFDPGKSNEWELVVKSGQAK